MPLLYVNATALGLVRNHVQIHIPMYINPYITPLPLLGREVVVVHLWVHAQLREPAPHHCAKGALVEH